MVDGRTALRGVAQVASACEAVKRSTGALGRPSSRGSCQVTMGVQAHGSSGGLCHVRLWQGTQQSGVLLQG